MLSNRVRSFINRYNLLSLEQVHLVALSGGADSVALLLLLKELGYRIEAIHCNFHLRGAESDADEQFCVTLCKQEGIPLHRVHFDTKYYAETHGVSIEMAARELRYAYFETLRNDMKAAEICVAHHREDSIETVLLNMIRGTGIDGLTGIAPRRGHIVRPLLEETKKALLAYLESRNQRYVTDSSNLVADVKRNKVRLQLLPLLEEMNPSVTESVHRMSQHLAEVMKMADSAIPAVVSNLTVFPQRKLVKWQGGWKVHRLRSCHVISIKPNKQRVENNGLQTNMWSSQTVMLLSWHNVKRSRP